YPDPAPVQADSKLQVSGHQGATVAVHPSLEIAQHRLDITAGHGSTHNLTGGKQSFPMAYDFHGHAPGCVLPGFLSHEPLSLSSFFFSVVIVMVHHFLFTISP